MDLSNSYIPSIDAGRFRIVTTWKAAMFGPNVVTEDGKVWKHHRKIASKAVSPKNIQLVHAETVRQTGQMLASWEKERQIVVEKYVIEVSY